ncbi:ATP-binding protein, partial [Candidatus Poribacteria bacterium]|nr:ATP-binding protein [Candidatus Poribacteria bacterium]
DLGETVARIVRLFEKGLPPNIRLVIQAGPPAPVRVTFAEAQLRQVVLNLLRNSQEAIGGAAGQITVSVAAEREFGVVTIRDNGPGMDGATLAQIFDPFFTTRPEGTGLGLPLSRSLVEAAGGRLVIESTKGAGAVAQLSLPQPPAS